MLRRYDLIILGGGSAAFAAAIKASEIGLEFAMIENGAIGGTCVNVGCIPSKHLLEVGDLFYYSMNHGFNAVKAAKLSLNFPAAIKQKDDLVGGLRKRKYADVIGGLPGADFIQGRGAFTSKNQIKVNHKTLTAKKFVIATGSSPQVVPIKGIDKVKYLTSNEALKLRKLPESMIIIGGRSVGLEFAQMYAHFGTRVTVLQRGPRILPEDEPEISEELTRSLRNEGIAIYTNVVIHELSEKNGMKIAICDVGGGRRRKFEAKQVLMATGRKPNTENLGLDRAGVETEKGGFIKINEYMQTTNLNMYAAGDCASGVMLETVAAKMGNIAVKNAFEGLKATINLKEVPSAVFTNPQAAKVGYTEEEYAKTHACACRTLGMELVPKAEVLYDTRGVIKMVVDPNTLKIVGVHIVSPLAAEMIHEATLAVKFGLTIDNIVDTVHVFPTLSEAIKLVAQSFRKDVSKLSCCVE